MIRLIRFQLFTVIKVPRLKVTLKIPPAFILMFMTDLFMKIMMARAQGRLKLLKLEKYAFSVN